MKKVLINYTNHPSAKWSSDQKDAALAEWRDIVDIPFPQTEPEWNEAEVVACFDAFMAEVADRLAALGSEVAGAEFLIMGEFRYTYYAVRTLKERGHRVFAHAGKRDVEVVDNKSIYTFRFGRFVEYF